MAVHECHHCGAPIGVWEPAVFLPNEVHATTQAGSNGGACR
jgi:hypothetical protein